VTKTRAINRKGLLVDLAPVGAGTSVPLHACSYFSSVPTHQHHIIPHDRLQTVSTSSPLGRSWRGLG